MLISDMIFLKVSLMRAAPNTNEQRSRSGLCESVTRREATETEGLVHFRELGKIPVIRLEFAVIEISKVQQYIYELASRI